MEKEVGSIDKKLGLTGRDYIWKVAWASRKRINLRNSIWGWARPGDGLDLRGGSGSEELDLGRN